MLAIVGGVTWCVAAEGAWGAAINFFAVLFAGLLAMNFFEPLAAATNDMLGKYADFVSLLVVFGLVVTGIRFAGEYYMPTYVEVHPLLYDIGRWGFGLITGYCTMAIILTSLHTAPLPREFLGFSGESRMMFGLAPDRQWLGFTQFTSERIYTSDVVFDGEQFPQIPEKPISEDNMRTWSSFPMRYAARREALELGVEDSPVTTAPPTPTPQQQGPAGPQQRDM
ncbi:MAG: CvpA family protein [Planctomycetaceae bacterium]